MASSESGQLSGPTAAQQPLELPQLVQSIGELQQQLETYKEQTSREAEAAEEEHKRKQQQLEEQRVDFENEKKRVKHANAQDTDTIRLNVGGRLMLVQRSTLCAEPGSLLASLFNGGWETDPGVPRDETGAVFFDFNPEVFALLLDRLTAIASPQGHETEVAVPAKYQKPYEAMELELDLYPKTLSQTFRVGCRNTGTSAPGQTRRRYLCGYALWFEPLGECLVYVKKAFGEDKQMFYKGQRVQEHQSPCDIDFEEGGVIEFRDAPTASDQA